MSSDDDEFESCVSNSSSNIYESCRSHLSSSSASSNLSNEDSVAGSGIESSTIKAEDEEDQVDQDGNSKAKKTAELSKSRLVDVDDDDSATSTLEDEEKSHRSVAFDSDDDESLGQRQVVKHIRGAASDETDEDLVKEDVSRLCNEIAEAVQPDFQKQAEIERACFENVSLLKGLAISEGGLLSNPLRKRAWPALLEIVDIEERQYQKVPNNFQNVDEKIRDLVKLDVNRVLKRFPPNLSETQQDHIQAYLNNLVLAVLNENPNIHYYQGFHDICLTFLLVCLAQNVPFIAYLSLNKLVQSSLAPFMEKTMDATNDIIHVVFAIIEMENKALYNKIVIESKCPAAFCLAWVITWFSHTLPNDTDIFRLADFILGCHDQLNPSCLVPVFLSAALLLRSSDDILENVTDTDIASMHYALSQLPLRQESLEPWLKDSLRLIKKYAGHEKALMIRAVKIKQMQHNLWNEESASRRPVSRRSHRLAAVGRFIFIRHRWFTVAILVLGAAYLTQKYGFGNQHISSIRSLFVRTFRRPES